MRQLPGFIGDPELFDSIECADGLQQNQIAPELLSTILTRSARAKAQVVSQDERELTRLRATLNYGHPIEHTIENVTKYTIDRGEAGFILQGKIGSTRTIAGGVFNPTQDLVSDALIKQVLTAMLPIASS